MKVIEDEIELAKTEETLKEQCTGRPSKESAERIDSIIATTLD